MYSDDFYNQEIQSNIKLLNSNKKKKRKLAEKNLLELKGRLKSELRAAQNQINNNNESKMSFGAFKLFFDYLRVFYFENWIFSRCNIREREYLYFE